MKLIKIGEIQSPYEDWAPSQSPEKLAENKEAFKIVLDPQYSTYLNDLDSFTYIYVLYYLDRHKGEVKSHATPPWAKGKKVGLFASRSPKRPNPVGLSVVKLLEVRDNELLISPIDAFNKTPVIDIKPYFKGLDTKEDANLGWLDSEEGAEHIMQHLRAVPHEHGHEHLHEHNGKHEDSEHKQTHCHCHDKKDK